MEEIFKQPKRLGETSNLSAKEMLTFDEVMMLTGFSRAYLYKLTCYRQIPYYKPNGKRLYFDRKEIENWLRRGRVNTVEESNQIAATHILNQMTVRNGNRPTNV